MKIVGLLNNAYLDLLRRLSASFSDIIPGVTATYLHYEETFQNDPESTDAYDLLIIGLDENVMNLIHARNAPGLFAIETDVGMVKNTFMKQVFVHLGENEEQAFFKLLADMLRLVAIIKTLDRLLESLKISRHPSQQGTYQKPEQI